MIEIILVVNDNNSLLMTGNDVIGFAETISLAIDQKKFLAGHYHNLKLDVNKLTIHCKFSGCCLPEEEEQNLINYLGRSMNLLIEKIGLEKIYKVCEVINYPFPNDEVLGIGMFKPKATINSTLLDKYIKDDEIPAKYLCQLTFEIMDKPIYTPNRPDLRYEYKHWIYWMFSAKEKPLDPITQTPMPDTISDAFVMDNALKAEINSFVKENVALGFQKTKDQNQKLIAIVKNYMTGLSLNISQMDIDNAFRGAAAENNVGELELLLPKISNINAQDNNSQTRLSALHRAVINKSSESVQWLMKHKADINIFDAQRKSPLNYADADLCSILLQRDQDPSTKNALSI